MNAPSRTFSPRIYGVLMRGEELLLTRSVYQGREFVNFPGGGIAIGEAPGDALRREFLEETGLEVRLVRTLYASEGAHPSTTKPFQLLSIYWLVEEAGGRLRTGGNGDDVVALFWADAKALPTDEMFPADREFVARLPGILKV